MIGIVPGRLVTRQRLFTGVMLIVVTSLLNLIPSELGPFGSPWPIALLWAVCGWSGLGPNVTIAGLLFVLGLWVDVLAGTLLGTWACVILLTYVIILLMKRFLGLGGLQSLGSAIVCSVVLIGATILVGIVRGSGFSVSGAILPVVTSVALYQLVSAIFELSEDET